MQVSLDYAAAREIVYLAVRRSAAFLGFGINAARDERLKDFTLSREIEMQFLPATLNEQQVADSKHDFEQWVIANGLRELTEGFSVFLDRLFENSIIASMNGQPVTPELQARTADFKNKGLPGKQQRLREDFGIKSEFSASLKSLYEARNCLSHERGIVSPTWYNTADGLEISWRAMELLVVRDDGSEQLVELKKGAPAIEGPGTVALRAITRTRKFKAGNVVTLSVKELAEICAFVYLAADSFVFPAIAYAKTKGVVISSGPTSHAPAPP